MDIPFDGRLLAEARSALVRADADLHFHLKGMVRGIRAGYQKVSSNSLTFVDDGFNRIVHDTSVLAVARLGVRAERVIEALIASFTLAGQKISRCLQQLLGDGLSAVLEPLLKSILAGLADALVTQLKYAGSAAVAGAIGMAWTGPGAVVGAAAGWSFGMGFASTMLVAQGLMAMVENVVQAYPAIYACYQHGIALAWGTAEAAPLVDVSRASEQFANGHLLLCAELLNALPLLLTRGKGGQQALIDTGKNGALAGVMKQMERHPHATADLTHAAASLKPPPRTGNGGKPAPAPAAATTAATTAPRNSKTKEDAPKQLDSVPADKKQPENIKCKECPTRGHPVNPIFGCKILNGAPDLDFALPGMVPLLWQRQYASDNPRVGWLGQGWSVPISLALELRADRVMLLDAQHRRVTFAMPQVGQSDYSRHEQVRLHRRDATTFELIDADRLCTQFRLPHPNARVAHLSAITDRNGNTLAVHYDSRQRPVQITDSTGRHFALQFTAHDRLESVSELLGQPDLHGRHADSDMLPLVRYEYDAAGDLIRVRNRCDEVTREFGYRNHMLVRHAQPGGLVSEYQYSEDTPQGRVVRSWSNLGQWWTFAYGRQQTLVTDQLGRTERFNFDSEQRFTGQVDALGGVTQRQLDAFGNVTAMTDAAGATTRYAYDARSRVTHVMAPDGATTTLTYDADLDKPITMTDALGALTTLQYDARANLIAITDALGHCTRYDHDARGLVVAVTDAHGGVKRMAYSEAGLLTAYTDCAHRTTRHAYDREGNLTATEDALGQRTMFAYDALNRLIAVTHADGSNERTEYDRLGRLSAYTNAAGQRTTYALDLDGQPLARTDALSATLHYRYDTARRLTTLVNENGAAYAFAYDPLDRLIQETGVDGRVTQYRHDKAGRLSVKRELGTLNMAQLARLGDVQADSAFPDRIETTYRRDQTGQLVEKIVSRHGDATNPATPAEQRATYYRFDAAGRLVAAANADAVIDLQYDLVGQLIAETSTVQGTTSILRHAYDALGNRLQTKLPDGRTINHLFYGSGHLHRIDIDGNVVSDIDRDALHREIGRTQGALTSTFGLDAAGRLRSQHAVIGPGIQSDITTALIARRYDYDRAGNLTGIDDVRNGLTTYRYDAIGRILAAAQPALQERFAFDPAHNLIDGDHAGDPGAGRLINNRLAVFEDKRYRYDSHGNLVDKKIGKHTRIALKWNAEHQLTQATTSRGAHTDAPAVQTVDYGYDPFGRRIVKRDAFGVTRFMWDGNRLLSEARGQHTRTYLYAPDSFVPLAQVESHSDGVNESKTAPEADAPLTTTATILYFHTDHLGTPRELTTPQGQLRWTATYKAWGNTLRVETTDLLGIVHDAPTQDVEAFEQAQPLRFQGQYYDVETGLHYNRFRYYDPDCGRFVSQDPIGLVGGNNLYQYGPNPTAWIDPLGLQTTCVCHCNLVNLASPQKTRHILQGDRTGGGHLSPGQPGKTPFPSGWDRNKVMHEISDVATDPASVFTPCRGGREKARGTRDAVEIEVILESTQRGGGIVTGYPINLPRNP